MFSDAVPSIFPWEVKTVNIMETQQISRNEAEQTDEHQLITPNEEIALPNENENDLNISGSSKGSEVENMENIKKFIESQDKDIQDLIDKNVQMLGNESKEILVGNIKIDLANLEQLVENEESPAVIVDNHVQNDSDDTMEVASSVLEMILSETESNVLKSDSIRAIPKQGINPGKLRLG